jgi:hypothetical protein
MQAVSRLYGRRIRGDVGPIGLDPRTRLPGAILAPAVSLTGADQYYTEESDVQNFALASRMVVDQRTFHYARARHAIADGVGVNYLAVMTEPLSDVFLNAAAPDRVIGDTTLAITVGAFQGSAVLANELVDGFIEIWPVGGFLEWRRIIANTASAPAGAGGVFTVTVDRPFLHNLPFATTGCLIHPCIYRAIMSAGDFLAHGGIAGFTIAVGLPPIAVPLNHYFWLQTWGPCCIGPTAGYPLEVGVPDFMDVYMDENGAIASAFHQGIGAAGTPSPQRIGYALGAENIGTLQIMLQLAP